MFLFPLRRLLRKYHHDRIAQVAQDVPRQLQPAVGQQIHVAPRDRQLPVPGPQILLLVLRQDRIDVERHDNRLEVVQLPPALQFPQPHQAGRHDRIRRPDLAEIVDLVFVFVDRAADLRRTEEQHLRRRVDRVDRLHVVLHAPNHNGMHADDDHQQDCRQQGESGQEPDHQNLKYSNCSNPEPYSPKKTMSHSPAT